MLHSFLIPSLERTYPFRSQSQGILRRHATYPSWSTHAAFVKRAVTKWLTECSLSEELNILGAGSLLDIDIYEISKKCKRIVLTDASSYNINIWQDQKVAPDATLVHCIQDITGVLLEWSEHIILNKPKNFNKALSLLRTMAEDILPQRNRFYKVPNIISLNILSQLPLYFQNFIFKYFEEIFGSSLVNSHQEDILEALIPSSQRLIESHLESLKPRNRGGSTLLICDLFYYFNVGSDVHLKINVAESFCPTVEIQRKEVSPNQSLSSTIGVQNALFKFDVLKWLKEVSASFDVKYVDSWIWEIVPLGMDEDAESHLVAAYTITQKRNSN